MNFISIYGIIYGGYFFKSKMLVAKGLNKFFNEFLSSGSALNCRL